MAKPTMKTISQQTYLQALGLFTLANQASKECDRARRALEKLLGVEQYGLGHLEDSIYDNGHPFDEAMKLDGFKWTKR